MFHKTETSSSIAFKYCVCLQLHFDEGRCNKRCSTEIIPPLLHQWRTMNMNKNNMDSTLLELKRIRTEEEARIMSEPKINK